MTLGLALAACGSGTSSDDAGNMFVAYASTFQPFRTWTSFQHDLEDSSLPAGVNGPRTQYLNMAPPHGSTEFPVGTVIVESRESGTMNIFAGVKRGGGYNSTGAKNWEWFELAEASGPGSTVSIVWRGLGPPPGDQYGGDANTCNTCHTTCGGGNDYVCSPYLQLAGF
ncbi:MAG TPA: hypothetical protein VMJ10_36935 [Kofleriaceae bacterium]|nr:hypothetical protein [Kofleriaceae bacterium]